MGIVVTKYGRMHVIDSDAVVSKSLGLYGEWAEDELSLLKTLIEPGMRVLDVGAFIGTHTLAFANFCGSQGAVTSFEPRREIFDVLAANVALNGCTNVTVSNLGLAEKPFELTLDALDLNNANNFGGLALEGSGTAPAGARYQTSVITLDSLNADRVDLIKLDVEGMELRVLEGASATIERCRPIVFCECNDLQGGAELLGFCSRSGYQAYGYLAPAFNPHNFNGNAENIWGDGKELALLLLPAEKVQQSLEKLRGHQVFAVARIDDLVLPMLFKPQYVPEVLEHTPGAALLGTRFPSPLAGELRTELEGVGGLMSQRYDEFVSLEELARQRGVELHALRDAREHVDATHADQMWKVDAELQALREARAHHGAAHEDLMRKRDAELQALREARAHDGAAHEDLMRRRDAELQALREARAQDGAAHEDLMRQRDAELQALREAREHDSAVYAELMRQRDAELQALRDASLYDDAVHEDLMRERDAELQTSRAASARATVVHEAMLRTAIRFDTEVARLNAHIAQQNDRLELARLESEQAAARQAQLVAHQEQLVARQEQLTACLAEAQAHIVETKARSQAHIADVEARLRAVYASRSWRITRPLRGLAQRLRGNQLDDVALPQAFAFEAAPTAVVDDLPPIDNTVPVITLAASPLPSAGAGLYASLANGSLRQPAVIFDHNGGGGSNAYSRGIISAMVAQGEMVLRVYCYEAQWFIQWVDGDQVQLFSAISLEQIFDLLLAAGIRNIVVNSVYGYMDVAAACRGIASLARSTGAALDFKVHDFLALCPSPHLSDFEQKYCGVPSDPSVCRDCLKVNGAWYHSWFPVANRPSEIKAWRKPFAELFNAATTISFFDASSVPILRKDFSFDDSKVRVVPHTSAYFRTARVVSIQGPLHIGVLGTLSHLKGGHAVVALQEYIEQRQLAVPLTVVGQSYTPLSEKVTVYGSYATDDLPDIVERLGINVIFMATIVPETFSYTISEAMEMGLPIVAFDIGAQANRLKDYVFGKVIPLGATPQTILAAMDSCLKAAQEMKK